MGDFQAELESIQKAAKDMSAGAIATATELKSVLGKLAGSTTASDWSDVPSCRAFGSTYVAAIKAYEAAAADMLSDAQQMQQTLEQVYNDYKTADERRRDDFDARMATLGGEGYMTEQDNQRKGYQANHGDLHSDDPQAAPDQSGSTATQGDGNPTTSNAGPGTGTANNRVR